MNIEEKLKDLNITLPDAPHPVATYQPFKQFGNKVIISGQGPIINGEQMFTGKLGAEYGIEEGKEAARLCALNLLAQVRLAIGDLNRVKQIVNLRSFVAGTDEFYDQPQVTNGASDLLVEIFGEKGKHARCALGTNVLPGNIPVEIELMVEID